MNIVKDIRQHAEITQTQLAEMSGTSQPTIAMYESAAKSPNWRTLLKLVDSTDSQLAITIVPKMTRDQKRSLALHQKIVELLEHDYDRLVLKAKRNIKTMRQAVPNAKPLLDEWATLLTLNKEMLLPAIVDPGLRGRDRRQVSPFSGILTAQQRTSVLKEFRKSA